ncbi:unnamed protein product [Dicrocoelium dendriticum]|nr:unnamed protein product [Dicrocoelium dendriticum]
MSVSLDFVLCFRLFSDKLMVELECLAATGPTGANPGFSKGGGGDSSSSSWGASNEADFSRIFLGGLQPTLLELDAQERWGQVIRTTDVGIGGSVVLRSFTSGLCAGTTNGKVIVLDPRTHRGIVRELAAHTGEISDITVAPYGYSLVTCGWSRLGDSGLRVDRLLKVYDLRSGRAQAPLSTSLDPCFARFFSNSTNRLLTASQGGSFQTIECSNRAFSPDDLGQLWPTYDRLVALDISHNGNGVIFGTETGHLQLYLRDMNVYHFNAASLPTEFASPLAESLWPTNSLGASVPPSYPLMLMENPANSLYGTNMMTLAKAAADAAELQLLAASLHQPAATASDNMHNSESFELVERRKAEAANEAVMVTYKPVEYEDYRFSSASIPFCANPPPILTKETSNSTDSNVHSRNHRTEQMCTSDWPEDLCQPRPRPMIPVDPELIVGANRKRAVRKPLHWGSVWHPYVDDPTANTPEDTTLGRFVSVTPVGMASAS